jgi:dTDP-glucose 4,6-dehydratase
MRIVISGGLGFIGSNFISKALKKNYKIYNIDKESYASNKNLLKIFNKNKNFKHKKLDIVNFKLLRSYVLKIKPDLIINFAAESHVDNSINSPKKFINSNIFGTYNLLEIARLVFSKKKKFKYIQISTDEVYGDLKLSDKSKFNEKTAYNPSSPYSASKASADLLVKAWGRTFKLPIIITNSSNNFGYYQNKEKLIPKTILSILKGKKIPIFTSGNQVRNWIFVEDNVNAIFKIIKKGVIGESYNIGSKTELSNIKLVKLICYELSKYKNYTYQRNLGLIKHVRDRPGHDKKYSINVKKLKKLGWVERADFKKAIKKTIKWYVENKNEY